MTLPRPTIIQKPWAESGNKNTIPLTTSTPGAASLAKGFPPETMFDIGDGGISPDGLDMNGILNIITQHIRYMNAGGVPHFDATLCAEIGGYPYGVVLQDNAGNNLYRNSSLTNTVDFNTHPESIGVSWHWIAGITKTLTAGGGLVGGGLMSGDITLEMGTPGTCGPSTTNAVTEDSHTHALNFPSAGTLTAGLGLTGGGSLSGDVTLNLGTPSTCSGSTTNTATEDNHTHSLAAAAADVAGVIRIATNAESYAGSSGLIAVAPAGLAYVLTSLFGKRSFSANDYIRIPDVPGGLILQWCKIVDNGQTNSFPIAFSTAVLGMVATMIYDGYHPDAATVFPVSTTQFRARIGETATVPDTIYVFSWGF